MTVPAFLVAGMTVQFVVCCGGRRSEPLALVAGGETDVVLPP